MLCQPGASPARLPSGIGCWLNVVLLKKLYPSMRTSSESSNDLATVTVLLFVLPAKKNWPLYTHVLLFCHPRPVPWSLLTVSCPSTVPMANVSRQDTVNNDQGTGLGWQNNSTWVYSGQF